MKKLLILFLALIVCNIAFAQKKSKGKKGAAPSFPTRMDTLNYILGADVGKNMQKGFFEFRPEAMLKGMIDGANKADTIFSDSIKEQYITELQNEARKFFAAKQEEENAVLKKNNLGWLDNNKKDTSIKVTASGLQYKVMQDAKGPKPLATDKVKVHYEGRLIDGSVFDSSIQRGEPIEFPLNAVIPGWTEGVQLMSKGATYEFYIPYNLGYGEQGSQRIPPYSTLIFVVELLDFSADTATK